MRLSDLRRLWTVFAIAMVVFLAGCSSDESSPAPPSDKTPPTVTGSFPENGAMNVSRSGPFWVAFSEPMNAESVEGALSFTPGPVPYDVSWRGDTLFIVPNALLSAGASYTITVGAGSEDRNGNALGTAYVIGFSTTSAADNTPPQVVSTVPANGATGVLGIQPIEITWSESMNRGSTEAAVSITPEPAEWWIEWTAVTMTIYHSAFPANQSVTVVIGTGATDLAGNHLAAPFTLGFTTKFDSTRPYLLSAAPANGATAVSTGLGQVVFTFSEPMDQSSFDIPAEMVDARMMQTVREEPYWNADYSRITVPINRTLLPGCTYWVQLYNVTDAAGNVIDPNPTPYEFTTSGAMTLYPVKNGNLWKFRKPSYDVSIRTIENYVVSSGNFDEVFRDSYDRTDGVSHLRKTSSAIYHRGRSEYDDGTFLFTMMWDEPIPYIKFPFDDYLGTSWSFATEGTINPTRSVVISGRIEIEPLKVNLVHSSMLGTYRGCYVHHLYAHLVFYQGAVQVEEMDVHEKTWFSPGVGPVQIVSQDIGGSDTLLVYDWSL